MSDWHGLRSACGQDLSFDADRFDELPMFTREPVRAVNHDVRVFSDFHWGDVGRGWFFFAECPCDWQSAVYRSQREAECAARLHDGAMRGEVTL